MSKRNNDNSGSNILLWILGIGVAAGAGFAIYKMVKKKNTTTYVVPTTDTTTDTDTATQPTFKERAKDLAKDAASTGVSRAIDSLFNRMFN